MKRKKRKKIDVEKFNKLIATLPERQRLEITMNLILRIQIEMWKDVAEMLRNLPIEYTQDLAEAKKKGKIANYNGHDDEYVIGEVETLAAKVISHFLPDN